MKGHNIQSIFLVIAGALLFALCLPPFSLWWLSPFILLPVWFTFEKSLSYRRHFMNGFCFGFSIYALLFYWIPESVSEIANLNIFLSIILCATGFALIGVMYGFLFILIKFLWDKKPWLIILIFPGFEWLCLPVFPITIGYAWRGSVGGVQAVDIGGVYFLSSLCCLYSYLIYLGVKNRSKQNWYWVSAMALLLAQYSYGCYRIFSIQNSTVLSTLNVSVLQTGISPIVKRDDTTGTFAVVSEQLKAAVLENKEAQLIVLPESIFVPTFKTEEDVRLSELRSMLNKNQGLVFGCNTAEGKKTYNSMGFIQNVPSDHFAFYRKQKLLLLGEYLPLMKYTPRLAEKISELTHTNEFDAGEKSVAFSFNEFKVLPFICIESMYGLWVAKINHELNDTDLLINITEDGWFGTSKASALHLNALVFRAIEMRKPLIRCVNVGYSSFTNEWGEENIMDLTGHTIHQMNPSSKYHLVSIISKRSVFSFYAWGGYFFEYISMVAFVICCVWFVLARWRLQKLAK